jgi:hypothetical protein
MFVGLRVAVFVGVIVIGDFIVGVLTEIGVLMEGGADIVTVDAVGTYSVGDLAMISTGSEFVQAENKTISIIMRNRTVGFVAGLILTPTLNYV